jgi:hypothetical protein
MKFDVEVDKIGARALAALLWQLESTNFTSVRDHQMIVK